MSIADDMVLMNKCSDVAQAAANTFGALSNKMSVCNVPPEEILTIISGLDDAVEYLEENYCFLISSGYNDFRTNLEGIKELKCMMNLITHHAEELAEELKKLREGNKDGDK